MGVGLNDVPRGSLGHWIQIENKKIKNYQYVVPSTWNLGPRDANNKTGAGGGSFDRHAGGRSQETA